MAQSVERRLGKAEVTGSIPVISLAKGTRRIYWFLFSYIEKIFTEVKLVCANEFVHLRGI